MDAPSELQLDVPVGAGPVRAPITPAIWPGKSFPLGAQFDGAGVNFAIFSEVAERVDLCLFDEDGRETALTLPERRAFCWHGYVPGIRPGQQYGFRVHGPWKPDEGLRCNPAKLLLDPYARAIKGDVVNQPAIFGHVIAPDGAATSEANTDDSAPFVPRSVVVDYREHWPQRDAAPRHPLHRSVIYELHVKGFTKRREDLPPEVRGTYAGLTHPAVIKYLQQLGITAVELMPIHHFVHDGFLIDRGLRNYWGYNSIGFFAPHAEYSSRTDPAGRIGEFREMVCALHRAGIEVILDVVYNHTAEGNHLGPSLSFRGIDNRAYYRLQPDQPQYYTNYTGTGNSMNTTHPSVLQLIMDSLRYWVQEMHVDGFRFDLASTLAREVHHVDAGSSFFDVIQQDPVLNRVKLIAEPWDVGDGGYQVGNFPPRWSEWNGQYRDAMRDFWRGEQSVATFASRFAGSSDLYARNRRPDASINFITAHDGFTLRDLVSYNEKHNEANGDNNQDGESHNRSWNCGAEGPTTERAVNLLRARQQRNMLTTLLTSQGVPMLLGGDERGRTQHGNNNAYCQDGEISWFDWQDVDADLLEFTRQLIRLRRTHPTFWRQHWLLGRSPHGEGGCPDIVWFTPDGSPMTDQDWGNGGLKSVMVFLNGGAIAGSGVRGERVMDNSFLLLFNAHDHIVHFTLRGAETDAKWRIRFDTRKSRPRASRRRFHDGERLRVDGRSTLILINQPDTPFGSPQPRA
jgi:glycogen operon protein